jgi:hypothetical protein
MRREVEQWPNGADRQFAAWLIDRFNADGSLPVAADRRWLARRWGCSQRTLSRRLAQLEAAGLIERTHTGRLSRRTGCYAHVSVITAAARFGQVSNVKPIASRKTPLTSEMVSPDHPTPHKSVTVGLHGLGFSDQVQVVTRASGDSGERRLAALGAQPADQVSEDQREADRRLRADHWPALARSRTDLPALRPGYGDGRFTAPPCRHCQTRHSPMSLCPDQAAALIAAEGTY